jgi:transposase
MTHSCDFREAAIAYKQKGHTIKQTCKTFNLPQRTYTNWNTLKQKTGNLKPKKHGPRKRKINPKNSKTT